MRTKDLRKVSTYPLVCLRFSQTLLHQDLGTFLRKKSLNLGYMLKLIRYIHLNPLRAKIIPDLKSLDKYTYSGHAAIMGKKKNNWQDTDYVLKSFNSRLSLARRRYREYVKKGISVGKRQDLIGGGLVRSAGGWDALKGLRKIKVYMKGDERILGDSNFVETVLKECRDEFDRRYLLKSGGYDFDTVVDRVAQVLAHLCEKIEKTAFFEHILWHHKIFS